jgi:hypothetical protein
LPRVRLRRRCGRYSPELIGSAVLVGIRMITATALRRHESVREAVARALGTSTG